MDYSESVKRTPNPQQSANILSLLTFFYTRTVFIKGLKNDLEYEDLHEIVDSCRSRDCADKLEKAFKAEFTKAKPSLYLVLWRCYGIRLFLMGSVSLAFSLIKSSLEPDAVSQLVAYFKPGQTTLTSHDVYYYASVLIFLKFLNCIYLPNYNLYVNLIAFQMRTSFSSLIYRKSLRLCPKSLNKTNLGNIVTLITSDVHLFESAIFVFNDIWVGTLETIYVCYLIYNKLGYTSTVGLLILGSAIPLQYYVATIIKKLRLKMNFKTDERMQEVQESLSAMKIIKMYTWELFFVDKINQKRQKEIKTLFIKMITQCALLASTELLGRLGFYALVMLYIYSTIHISTETIFYIMKCYNTLGYSISIMFTFGITHYANLVACLQRINNFLQLEEIPEPLEMVEEVPHIEPKINIKNATITMGNKDIIQDVTVEFKTGLNIVTGHLGCGKSSLIKAILKDYPLDKGEIKISGKISYASQEPWLFPATIKQNILFGECFNYERYNKVVDICALRYDLSLLENGDDTLIRDKGLNLSKGQQARINLARAVYKQSDIYLIDDSLTALDPHVQDHIFQKCIKEYLKDKLVILITHNSKHISQTDSIVILENGTANYTAQQKKLPESLVEKIRIIEDTSLIESKQEKAVDEEINEKSKLIENTNHKQVYHENKKKGGVALQVYYNYVRYGGGFLMVLILLGAYGAVTFSESSSHIMLTKWVNQESKIMEAKENYFENSSVTYDNLFHAYFSPLLIIRHHKNFNVSVLVPSTIWSENGTLILNQTLVPLNYSDINENQNKTLTLLGWIRTNEIRASKSLHWYTVFTLSAIALEFVKKYLIHKFGMNASVKLHKKMIKSIFESKMTFFDSFFIGNILNRFSQDLHVVDETLPVVLNILLQAIFGVAGIVGIFGSVSWIFIVSVFVVMIVLILLRYIYMPASRSLRRLEASTRSPIIGHLNSTMEGLTTVRAYKLQSRLEYEFDQHQDIYMSARFTSMCTKNAFNFYSELTSVIFNIYVIVFFLFINVDNKAGDVGLMLTQAGALTLILKFGLMQWSEIENSLTSVERVMEYTTIEPEISSGNEIPKWPKAGNVVFQNVTLQYPNSNEIILKNINFSVNPQEKIGIVGRTGAGKSSIISTLFKLYNHEGSIIIDGADTKDIPLKYLRKHISIIPQDTVIFSGTIRSNIDPLKEFSDEKIWSVLRKLNLDSKVLNLDNEIEDTKFSSGETQLISLARAIIRDNKIVILDEATASMDPETEKMVQKAIDDNFSCCTLFIIAHRLDSILNCNKILVLKDGKVAEFDSPDVLLNDKQSEFYRMIKQFKSDY